MTWLIARPSRYTAADALQLARDGFETWVPVQKEFRIVRNKKTVVEKRLMDCYVFLRGAPAWKARAYNLLMNTCGNWATVADAELAHLRTPESRKPEFPEFRRGQLIRIKEGPLEGHTGRVRWHKPKKGTVKLGTAFGAVELSVGDVEAI